MLNSYRILPTTGDSLNPCPRERRASCQSSSETEAGVSESPLHSPQRGLILLVIPQSQKLTPTMSALSSVIAPPSPLRSQCLGLGPIWPAKTRGSTALPSPAAGWFEVTPLPSSGLPENPAPMTMLSYFGCRSRMKCSSGVF